MSHLSFLAVRSVDDDSATSTEEASTTEDLPRFQHTSAQSLIKNIKPETVIRPSLQTPGTKKSTNVAGMHDSSNKLKQINSLSLEIVFRY